MRRTQSADGSPSVNPQAYEHRVETALHALAASVFATQKLATYLVEQQGTEWRRLDHLLRAADQELKSARRWIGRGSDIRLSRGRSGREKGALKNE